MIVNVSSEISVVNRLNKISPRTFFKCLKFITSRTIQYIYMVNYLITQWITNRKTKINKSYPSSEEGVGFRCQILPVVALQTSRLFMFSK